MLTKKTTTQRCTSCNYIYEVVTLDGISSNRQKIPKKVKLGDEPFLHFYQNHLIIICPKCGCMFLREIAEKEH